jgi:hypothetical protein
MCEFFYWTSQNCHGIVAWLIGPALTFTLLLVPWAILSMVGVLVDKR